MRKSRPPDRTSDSELIRLLRNREEKGLLILRQNYGGLLHYVVRGILQNPQDIEECLNDISLRVWEKVALYEEERGEFSAWLTVLARNTALDRARGKSRRPELLFSELSELSELFSFEKTDPVSCQLSPEEQVLSKERMTYFKNCLMSLKPVERSLFYRRYYYLQSERQIGAELGMTERAVEGKLYRIRKKLQKRIRQWKEGIL